MVDQNIFKGIYKDRRVLVTGHTGFKGSWLASWLTQLGANVAGYSKYIPTTPSHFETIGLAHHIQDFKADVMDFDEVKLAFDTFKPEIVFHYLPAESYCFTKQKPFFCHAR